MDVSKVGHLLVFQREYKRPPECGHTIGTLLVPPPAVDWRLALAKPQAHASPGLEPCLPLQMSPLGDRLLVKPQEVEKQTAGGILLSPTSSGKSMQDALVGTGAGGRSTAAQHHGLRPLLLGCSAAGPPGVAPTRALNTACPAPPLSAPAVLAVGEDVDIGVAAGDRVLFSKYGSSGAAAFFVLGVAVVAVRMCVCVCLRNSQAGIKLMRKGQGRGQRARSRASACWCQPARMPAAVPVTVCHPGGVQMWRCRMARSALLPRSRFWPSCPERLSRWAACCPEHLPRCSACSPVLAHCLH